MLLLWPFVLLMGLARVQAKSVFAHFMVGNTRSWEWDDWSFEMTTAMSAGIDAFALNIAYNDGINDDALPKAFKAAESTGFKLFFSFDYAGNGAWPKATVESLITTYAASSSYFNRGSQPLVSTFEGPGNSGDWPEIKKSTNCFFIPDWSSLGAQPAVELGTADGLFSWDAWPKGEQNMTTYPDASYYQFLDGLPYMAPVSPWFYTNLPGYNKNWLWRGDDLWFHRWQQMISIDHPPEFIEIISWNDFGESHYIGGLDSTQYEAFETGKAPYNYVETMPHDGWREFLYYYTALYKTGTAKVLQEAVVSWYRLNPLGACSDGGTTGDTATQLHLEFPPGDLLTDKVYFQALLTSAADVTVNIGGSSQKAAWDFTPYGGVGIYYGSVPLNGATGTVTVTITRSGSTVMTMNGEAITAGCSSGYQNYNAWVGVGRGPDLASPVAPTKNLAELNCTRGTGVYEYEGICSFTCANGYCPSSACICLQMGVADPPEIVGVDGYPAAGMSMILAGLCSFACNHGYCPSDLCSTTPNAGEVPTFSPFLPPACVAGTGSGGFEGLCSFGCNYGFCPMHACTCTTTGILVDAPPSTGKTGYYTDGTEDYGLCNFAVGHGYTPDSCTESAGDGDGVGRDIPIVTYDPAIWASPTAACEPPCIMVLPPITLGEPTTISLPPISTSLEVGGVGVDGSYTATTITTVIIQPAVTTSKIGISNYNLTTTTSGAFAPVIYPLPSVQPPPFMVTPNSVSGIPGQPSPRSIWPAPWPYGTSAPAPSGTSSSSTSGTPPLYIWWTADPTPVTTFPPQTVSWVTQWISEPTVIPVDGNPTPVVPCWAWFIWICPPNFGGITLSGWLPGIYPIGGPPPIGPGPLPPGVTLPPIDWPEITIGTDRVPTFRTPDPAEEYCETAVASVCTTTLSYDIVAKRAIPAPSITPGPEIPYGEFVNLKKRVTTTATTTISFCTQVTGCGAEDITRTTTEASVATTWPRIVIPSDPKNVASVRTSLSGRSTITYESKSDTLGTIFFYLNSCTDLQAEYFSTIAGVADVYIPRGPATAAAYQGIVTNPSDEAGGTHDYDYLLNDTIPLIGKRASAPYEDKIIDENMIQLSWPPTSQSSNGAVGQTFYYDDSAGEGTYSYSCDWGFEPEHDELSDNLLIAPLYPGPFPLSAIQEIDPKRHGTKCIAKMAGAKLGLAKKTLMTGTVINYEKRINDHWLDALVKIHDHIVAGARGKSAVVNLSASISRTQLSPAYLEKMAYIIQAIIDTGAVFVTATGNTPGYPQGYPALFGDPDNANHIPDLIVTGAVQSDGQTYDAYCMADWVTVYAPGAYVPLPNPSAGLDRYTYAGGTSYAGATVAGLAAYIRGVSPGTFNTAAAVKEEIQRLAYVRKRPSNVPDNALNVRYDKKVVWNGQTGSDSAVGGDGAIGSVPVPSPITISSAATPSPTCTSGAGCGVICSGYFCSNSNFTHNPDFEDPANPDSVQNPDSPNYGNWGGSTPLITATATKTSGGSTPSNTAADLIPDCLAVYIITSSSQSTADRGTIDGVIIYQGVSTEVCNGAEWCDDFREYGGILPPVCRAGPLTCGSGYAGSATQVVSGGTLDGWFGVTFKADDMAQAAYMEVPLTDTDVKDCATTIGSGSCKEERYGAYFGGDCSAYPLFQSWATNGLIAELSKEDAVASHPLDASVTN